MSDLANTDWDRLPLAWCQDCNRNVPLPHKGIQPADVPHALHCRCQAHDGETLEQFLQRVYDYLPPVECQGKCHDTCGPIIAFPVEIARMEAAGFPRVFRFEYPRGRCSFLTAQNRCAVHSVRPLICRLFGVAQNPMMICQHGCQPARWIDDKEAQWILKELTRRQGQMAKMAEVHVTPGPLSPKHRP